MIRSMTAFASGERTFDALGHARLRAARGQPSLPGTRARACPGRAARAGAGRCANASRRGSQRGKLELGAAVCARDEHGRNRLASESGRWSRAWLADLALDCCSAHFPTLRVELTELLRFPGVRATMAAVDPAALQTRGAGAARRRRWTNSARARERAKAPSSPRVMRERVDGDRAAIAAAARSAGCRTIRAGLQRQKLEQRSWAICRSRWSRAASNRSWCSALQKLDVDEELGPPGQRMSVEAAPRAVASRKRSAGAWIS
jgi:hypothetical protein